MPVMSSKLIEPRVRRWTLAEYYRAGEEGYFDRRRVQLIRGEVVDMPPHGHLHYLTLYYANSPISLTCDINELSSSTSGIGTSGIVV